MRTSNIMRETQFCDFLECDGTKAGTITKEGIINKVNRGESLTIIDNQGNPFNITSYNEFYIKIYPLVSIGYAKRWYSYEGRLLYPEKYDSVWVSTHTIKFPTLTDLLL